MEFAGWEDLFSEIILERGWDYFEKGCIDSLSVKNGEANAKVSGTNNYSVKIKWNGTNISSMSCNCPFDGNCKHIAAVMYALKEVKEPDENSLDELKELVSKADAKIVRTFLFEILKDDEELAERFKNLTTPSDKELDVEPFIKKAKKIANQCSDAYGFVDYYSISDGIEKIEQIFEKDLPLFLDKKQFFSACELVTKIFETFFDLQDDDEGSLYVLAEICTNAMKRILKTENLEAESFLFDWCTEYLESTHWDSYSMNEQIESFFMENFNHGQNAQRKLAYTKKRAEAGNSYWMRTYLTALEENKAPWKEIAGYCKSHIEDETVRDWYVNQCAEKGFTGEAIQILEDACKSETDNHKLKILKERLKNLYSKNNDREKLYETLWWLVENGGYSVDYLNLFKELKTFYDEESWKTEREKIFAKASGNSLCELYKNEKLFDRMLPVVLKSYFLDDVIKYADDLSDWSEKLLDKCEELLRKQAERSSSRNQYKDLARNLKLLRKIKGGEKRIKILLSDWKHKYYRRKAMLEELGIC